MQNEYDTEWWNLASRVVVTDWLICVKHLDCHRVGAMRAPISTATNIITTTHQWCVFEQVTTLQPQFSHQSNEETG